MKHLHAALALALLAACGRSVAVEPDGGAGAVGGSGATITTTGWSAGGAATITTSGGGGGVGAGTGTGGVGAGTTGSAGAGGSPETCVNFGDPCTSCASVACPGLYCACSENPECFALSSCLSGCADEPCRQACRTDHEAGISDLYLLSGCAAESCAAECPSSKPVDECTTCVLDTCPDTYNACLADAECVALYQCLTSCGNLDLSCQQGCYAQHGAGTVKLQALLECDVEPCGPVCP